MGFQLLATNHLLNVRRFALTLGLLSFFSLVGTAWVLVNVRHEQAIAASLIRDLQGSDLQKVSELSSELSLQWILVALLLLNVIATAVAFVFALRGYSSSERNLEDVKVLATDILASMDAGVITTDLEGRITSINPRGLELIGLQDDSKRMNIHDLGPEHALLSKVCEDIRKYHHPIRDRDYFIERNGNRLALRSGCTMLRNRQDGEIGMVIHVRDVTEKTLMEERLRRMERYMGLGSLAAGLQHEIKNPLNALTLHIQLLCERLQEKLGDDEMNSILEVLNTEVKRIGNVLDGFRNYASIHEIGRSPVDVRQLIEKLVRLLRLDADQKKVTLSTDWPGQDPCQVLADAAQLEQVFLNLALNGIAAMPDGGELRFRVSRHEDKVRIDVSDSGHGIPPDIQPMVFDPYFTTRHDGMGMGLALCDKIVRQHEGSIDFESNSRGTMFSIWLPSESS